MAYTVALPDGRTVEFPDDVPKDKAAAVIRQQFPELGAPQTTMLGGAKELFKGLVPGAVGLVESAATGASALLPEDMEKSAREKIKSVATAAKAPFTAAPGYEESIPRKLGEALGSTVPFLAAGPFGLAGRAAAVATGVGAGAGEARTRAEQEGATADQRGTATALGTLPGALEAFAPIRILSRIPTASKAAGVEAVKRAMVAGGEEAAQEAASGFAQNLISRGIYKPEQALIEGLGEQAAYGGATGAIVQGLLDLAIGRRARGAAPAPTGEQPAQPGPQLAPEAPAGTQGALFTPEEMGKPVPAPKAPTEPIAAGVPEGQQDLNLDFQREYADMATERERLRQQPQTPEVKARITELTGQMQLYTQSDIESIRAEKEAADAAATEEAATRKKFPALSEAPDLLTQPDEVKARTQGELFPGEDLGTAPEAAIAEPTLRSAKEKAPLQYKLPLRTVQEGREPKRDLTIPARPGELTLKDVQDVGVPLRVGMQPWFEQNVVGKTLPELQQLVKRQPELTKGPSPRAKILRELLAPQPAPFKETPRVEPTPAPTPAVEQRDEPRAGEPSVGVPSEPAAPVAPDTGGGVPTTAGAPVTPDGRGLVSAGRPAVPGAAPQRAEPAAVTKPVAIDPRMAARIDAVEARDEAREQDEYAAQRVDMVAAFKEKHDRNVKATWAAVQRARQALKTTTPQSSIAANDIDRAVYALEDAAQRYDRFVNDESVTQKALDQLEKTVNEIPQRITDLDTELKSAKAKPKSKPKAEAPKSVRDSLQAIIDDAAASKRSKQTAFKALDMLDDPDLNETAEDRAQNEAYAEKELQSAEQQRRFSTTKKAARGQSVDSLKQEIASAKGRTADALRRMIASGKVKLEEAHPDGNKGGMFDGKTVTLYAQGIPEGQALPVALHEVGAHMGMEKLLGTKQYDAVINKLLDWIELSDGSVQSKLAQAAYRRIPIRDIKNQDSTVARDEMVAYFVEELASAESKGQIPKLGPLRTMWNQIKTAITTSINKALGTSFGINDLTPQQIGAIAEAAMVQESKTDLPDTQAEAKKLFSTNYTADEVVDSMGDLTPVEKRGVLGLFKGAQDGERSAAEPGRGVKFRVAVADSAAAIEDKLSGQFNGAVRDSMGKLNPMGLYRQAQDYSKVLLAYFQEGSLQKEKETGQYKVVKAKDGSAPTDVFPLIYAWGDRTGRSKERAEQFASRVIEAYRLEQVLKANPDFPKHINDADRALLVAEYNADPAFAEMSAAMDKPRVALVDQMVKVGRLSKEQGDEWKSVIGYVPFDRIDDFAERFTAVKKTTGRSPLMLTKNPELKGSFTRPVGNVFENYLNTMGWMVGQVMTNDARVQTLRSLEDLGYTGKPSRMPGTKNRTAKAYVGGELMYWDLPSSYDVAAFQELNPPKAKWLQVLGQVSNVLRKSVTILPPFALKQVTDDVQRAIMTSGVKNPGALLRMTLSNFGGLALAELRGIRHPTVSEMEGLGLTGEFDFQQGKPAVSLLKDLGYRPRGKFETLMHRLEGITRASDLAVRKAIYDQTIKESQDQLLAQTRAREFINFRRRGSSDFVGAMVTTIPFFNAYIQGMDVLYRAASGKDSSASVGRAQARRMFYSRAAIAMTLSTLYALGKGDDDEDYNEMDLRTRDSNWILPGGFKLPVPTELGALFKVVPERIVEYMRRQGTPEEQEAWEATRTALTYIFEQYVGRVVPIPQAAKPLLEAWTNYSFFTGRELEGIYQKQQDPSMRRASNTSELAIAIANFSRDVVGVDKISPILVDNALSGYFGSTAGLLVAMTDSLLNPTRVDRPLHKYALLSNYLYDPVGTRRMTEFYDAREKVGRANATLSELMKTDIDRAVAYAEKNADVLMMESSINSTLEQLERTRAYRKFLNSKDAAADMPAEEREAELKEIKKMEVELTGWLREAKTAIRQ
jgi:hypothetical protein